MMKVLITSEVEIKNGTPTTEEVRLWFSEIVNYGILNCRNDLKYIPINSARINIGTPCKIEEKQ